MTRFAALLVASALCGCGREADGGNGGTLCGCGQKDGNGAASCGCCPGQGDGGAASRLPQLVNPAQDNCARPGHYACLCNNSDDVDIRHLRNTMFGFVCPGAGYAVYYTDAEGTTSACSAAVEVLGNQEFGMAVVCGDGNTTLACRCARGQP